MYADKLDTLGKKLADAALTLLVRLYPEVRQASTKELDAACAAMRAKSRSVIDELIDDAKDAPGVALEIERAWREGLRPDPRLTVSASTDEALARTTILRQVRNG